MPDRLKNDKALISQGLGRNDGGNEGDRTRLHQALPSPSLPPFPTVRAVESAKYLVPLERSREGKATTSLPSEHLSDGNGWIAASRLRRRERSGKCASVFVQFAAACAGRAVSRQGL